MVHHTDMRLSGETPYRQPRSKFNYGPGDPVPLVITIQQEIEDSDLPNALKSLSRFHKSSGNLNNFHNVLQLEDVYSTVTYAFIV